MTGQIISADKSIIPACDFESIEQLKKVLSVTKGFEDIRAYKVGFALGYGGRGFGLVDVVDTIKSEHEGAIVIFDAQKAGTDVPFTGKVFAKKMKSDGVDAVILAPRENDPVTQYVWTNELLQRDKNVIIVGEMTHRPANEAQERIYWNAVFQGVTDFVVPGNKPKRVEFYTKTFQEDFKIKSVNYATGFVSQGGVVSEAAKVAGDEWHAISGRAVYNPKKREDLNAVTPDEMHESIQALVNGLYAKEV